MITDSNIAVGDQLGAQMTTLAELIYISKESKQKLVFPEELLYFRRKFLPYFVFDLKSVEIIKSKNILAPVLSNCYCAQFKSDKTWQKKMKRIYQNKLARKLDDIYKLFIMRCCYPNFYSFYILVNGVHCDKQLFELKNEENYDIMTGFGTYRDFSKYSKEIVTEYSFKEDVIVTGNEIMDEVKRQICTKKDLISVHFRRTDYLVMSSLNLSFEYYKKAIERFDPNRSYFIVFSDDIEGCKNTGVFEGVDVYYMDTHSAAIDMYLMTLCNHNIIANSTFSFWGAFLNVHDNKKVVCPHDFIGPSAPEYQYLNGNYYPDEWIAI